MEDKSLYNSQQPQGISETLQNYIDAMVEEIVLEGKPFVTQKKYLKKFCENEELDYDKLEADIAAFIEIIDGLKKAFNTLQVKFAKEKGEECYISVDMVDKLIKHSSQPKQLGEAKNKKNAFKVMWLNFLLFFTCLFCLFLIYVFIITFSLEAVGCTMVIYGLYLQRRIEKKNPIAIRWLYIGSFVMFLAGLTDGGWYIGIIYLIITAITHFLYRK